jgi:metallophosphoesterase (TIGR00282 family)
MVKGSTVSMKLLYLGDIMGTMGLEVVKEVLPEIRQEKNVDVVIAQAENVSEGKGITDADFHLLMSLGVDFCTGGNWTLFRPEITTYLDNKESPIIRPANYPSSTPGKGYKYLKTHFGNILVISLLGQIVGKDSNLPVENPLKVIDAILEYEAKTPRLTTIVNFHGDYSSEKRVIGYYLDGRVGAVIGDHWHVPTADYMILPKGTAHMTDVGMCGSLDSSLGIELEVIIDRWKNSTPRRNILESSGRKQFNAALITIDESNGLADGIEHIQKIY